MFAVPMIDTIHFSLNNLKENYTHLYKTLVSPRNKVSTTYSTHSEYTLLERTVVHNQNTGASRERFHKVLYDSPSSHYKLIIGIDIPNDAIKFNVSVPKYLYGLNVIQYILHPNVDLFKNGIVYERNNISYHTSLLLKYLKNFFKVFFENEFPYIQVNMQDIEIKRLDLCYNQYFPTKIQALQYLDIQKQFKKRYLRENSSQATDYRTSIFYSSKDYSFKIYHKGTEFEKNDINELRKINVLRKARGEDPFDLPSVKSFADSYLRYELSFRTNYISQIYFSKIFRTSVSQWQRYKKLFHKLQYLYENDNLTLENPNALELVNKCIKFYDEKNSRLKRIQYWFNKSSQPIKPNQYKTLSLLEKFRKSYADLISSNKHWFMALPDDMLNDFKNDRDTDQNFLNPYPLALFGQKILSRMVDKFFTHIKDFTPEYSDFYQVAINRLNEYNNNQKENKKLSSMRLKTAGESRRYSTLELPSLKQFLLLMNYYSFDEVCEKLQYDKQTKYRYKMKLKKLGIEKTTTFMQLPYNPVLDYSQYYTHFQTNYLTLRKFFKKSLDI